MKSSVTPMAQDAPEALRQEWEALWQQAGAMPAPALLDRLLAAWSAPHRQYHTLQHLGECLANFHTLAHLNRPGFRGGSNH